MDDAHVVRRRQHNYAGSLASPRVLAQRSLLVAWKALGLSTTECKAVWLRFRLRNSKPRPPREVAVALKIREADLPSCIGVIRRKVPVVGFPVE
jgi:hypothetical protein